MTCTELVTSISNSWVPQRFGEDIPMLIRVNKLSSMSQINKKLRKKGQLISIYFFLSWNTRFEAMVMMTMHAKIQ